VQVSDPREQLAVLEATPPTQARMSRPLVLLFAVATGVAVASLYYAQPLLGTIRQQLHLSGATAGLLVTVAQLGYACGLMLLLPLGDLLERRRLVAGLMAAAAVALLVMGSARSLPVLLAAAALVGLLSVVAQILVPFAAALAGPQERGRVVGTVMSGLLLGILLARTVAGYLAELGGWPTVYFVAAALMLAMAIALRLALPRQPGTTGLRYPALIGSVFTLVRTEPVLRLRMTYGALTFAEFSILWTSLTFLLTGAPYHYSEGTVGLFGLAGVAGAVIASMAGRLADRGHSNMATGVAAVTMLVVWVPLAFGQSNLALLLLGIVVLDLGIQLMHVTSQSEVYRLRPEARSRLNSAYMTAYFTGGATGSALASYAFAQWGWTGVCAVGAAFGAATTLVWLRTLATTAHATN
jgi:predicted MFS family arabinose efflux permease